jgi:hypothetical protein
VRRAQPKRRLQSRTTFRKDRVEAWDGPTTRRMRPTTTESATLDVVDCIIAATIPPLFGTWPARS